MTKSFNTPYNISTPIQFLNEYGDFNLYIKREDKTPFSFGTKIRKFNGLAHYLKENKINEILLTGNPNSNFVSSFAWLFARENFEVYSIFYSKSKNFTTANSILSHRNSSHIEYSLSMDEMNKLIQDFKTKHPNGYVIPRYGITEYSLASLDSLWMEVISFEEKFDCIFIDIGSGLTYLSALNFFQKNKSYNPDLKINGIAIGASLARLERDLDEAKLKLGLKIDGSVTTQILEPAISPGFGDSNIKIDEFIQLYWKAYQIPLEPVYSGKSLYTIDAYLEEKDKKGNGLYIHQGGLLNHLDSFL